jgi:hypothetical protein
MTRGTIVDSNPFPVGVVYSWEYFVGEDIFIFLSIVPYVPINEFSFNNRSVGSLNPREEDFLP